MKAIPQHVLADFERFFAAYPRRPENPKAPARKVFAELVRAGHRAADLIAAAERYAALCAETRKDAKFIPHARTWLHQHRFEDFLEDASASAPAPLEPSPEHPLAFLRRVAGDASFASWLAPLDVAANDDGVVITAKTGLARDEVRRRFGRDIEDHFGPVQWAVRSKNP